MFLSALTELENGEFVGATIVEIMDEKTFILSSRNKRSALDLYAKVEFEIFVQNQIWPKLLYEFADVINGIAQTESESDINPDFLVTYYDLVQWNQLGEEFLDFYGN